jgi:hypothetical protein
MTSKQQYTNYLKNEIADAIKHTLWHMSFGDQAEQAEWFTYAQANEQILKAVETMTYAEFYQLTYQYQQQNQTVQLALL